RPSHWAGVLRRVLPSRTRVSEWVALGDSRGRAPKAPMQKCLVEFLSVRNINKYMPAKRFQGVFPHTHSFYVPRDPARELDKALKAAAIPKYTCEGKVDFHALRLAYIKFVLESGASVKEAQALARHATPAMTMNVYARTRNERLVQTVEGVGEMVSVEEKRAGSVPEPSDTNVEDEGYAQVVQEVQAGIQTVPKGGFEPPRLVRHHPLKMACLPIPPLRHAKALSAIA